MLKYNENDFFTYCDKKLFCKVQEILYNNKEFIEKYKNFGLDNLKKYSSLSEEDMKNLGISTKEQYEYKKAYLLLKMFVQRNDINYLVEFINEIKPEAKEFEEYETIKLEYVHNLRNIYFNYIKSIEKNERREKRQIAKINEQINIEKNKKKYDMIFLGNFDKFNKDEATKILELIDKIRDPENKTIDIKSYNIGNKIDCNLLEARDISNNLRIVYVLKSDCIFIIEAFSKNEQNPKHIKNSVINSLRKNLETISKVTEDLKNPVKRKETLALFQNMTDKKLEKLGQLSYEVYIIIILLYIEITKDDNTIKEQYTKKLIF